MGLLDKLRPQPKWKHPDAAVRVSGVEELDPTNQELLSSLSRDDTDPAVRRAAVNKLTDTVTLIDIARSDPDEGVRDEAQALLLAIALGTSQGVDAQAGEAAVAALASPKQLTAVARSAAHESVSLAALARLKALNDVKAMAAVARRAVHASTRLDAFAQISEPAELGDIALTSEHKDVALAALEQVSDRETLEAIATRGRNKAAAHRARAILRARDEAEKRTGEAREELHQRRLQICRTVQSLVLGVAGEQAAEKLAQAEAEWAEAGACDDGELAERYAAACASVHERLTREETARTEQEQRAQEIAQALEARMTLCEKVEAAAGNDAPGILEEARAAWAALPPMPAAEPAHRRREEMLRDRFERASAACALRNESWVKSRAFAREVEEVVRQAEQTADSVELSEATRSWAAIQRAWQALRATVHSGLGTQDPGLTIDDQLYARFADARARLHAREATQREALRQRQGENLSRLQKMCGRWEQMVASDALRFRDAERALREARAALDAPGPLPSKRDADETLRRLKAIHSALVARVQELHEVEEWKRWANANVQEELCGRMEALLTMEDLAEAARQLRAIENQWRQFSDAPRERSEVLWGRFRAARDQVRARSDTFFAKQAAEKAENLRRKEALCERAEALAGSTDWLRTADALKRLQAEWKTIKPSFKEKAAWDRFRKACDHFFTRRHEDLVRRKQEWASNLARKIALCEQAEALADSTDWEKASSELQRLLTEWRTVGSVRRDKAEAVWKRFLTARDRFLDRCSRRDEIKLAASLAEREGLCRELEALLPLGQSRAASSPENLAEQVQTLRSRWHEAETRGGLPRAQADSLAARFGVALTNIVAAYPAPFRGTDLDPERNRQRMEKLCQLVEGLLPATEIERAASPATILAQRLREALAANTIGGRVDEEAKLRAAAEDVRRAQAEWKQIGPVPGDIGRTFSERFERACRRFFEYRDRQRRRALPARGTDHQPSRGVPRSV